VASDVQQPVSHDPILDSLPHGLCVADSEGKILYINPALEVLLDWRSVELQGQLLSGCLEERIADPALALCWGVAVNEALAHGQTTYLNLPADLAGAHPAVSVTGVVAPWQDAVGGQQGVLVVLHDSARHQDLEGIRHRFLSIVSHELGSPLTNISAAADRVGRLLDGGDAEQWSLLQIIRSETSRLLRLLGQFLARPPIPAETVRPARSVTTLRPLLYRVAHTFQLRDSGHDITVQVPSGLPFVRGDADKIQEVLSNLVDNALRYSPPQTQITLSAEAWQDDVVVSVTDQGEGVATGDEKRLFDPLYRGADQGRRAEGLGMGLYISRALVQALGGELWHEGMADGGTRFCFTLPRAQGLPREDGEAE
jgi:signal transduction histidine kinase